MIEIEQFRNLQLHGGFVIADIQLTDVAIVDAIGREAVAQTTIAVRYFRLLIRTGLSDATDHPPAAMMDFNESDFERAAHDAHERWGNASPGNLNLLLQFHEFRGI